MPGNPLIQYQDISVRVFDWRALKRVDWFLALATVLLAAVGWTLLYSASRSSDSEANSDGLTTTLFPAASAAAIFQAPIIKGKFQGTITPMTPRGSW